MFSELIVWVWLRKLLMKAFKIINFSDRCSTLYIYPLTSYPITFDNCSPPNCFLHSGASMSIPVQEPHCV